MNRWTLAATVAAVIATGCASPPAPTDALAAKDYRHALWLAQEAQVDAELAQLKAGSARAAEASRVAP